MIVVRSKAKQHRHNTKAVHELVKHAFFASFANS